MVLGGSKLEKERRKRGKCTKTMRTAIPPLRHHYKKREVKLK
jgi:hypothetical protein